MKLEIKVGDIVFWNTKCYKEHFYIVLEDLTKANDYHSIFKCFSSYDGKLRRDSFNRIKYLSDGTWEYIEP